MNRRFTSLFLALISLVVLVTGVILYFMKSGYLLAFHEVFGAIMVFYMIVHAAYNIKPLKNYIKAGKNTISQTKSRLPKLSKEFVAAVLVCGIITAGSTMYGSTKKKPDHYKRQMVETQQSEQLEAPEDTLALANMTITKEK